MKDLFSNQADLYAQYRPLYPKELYDFVLGAVSRFERALDCATGNGQVARTLASHFQNVCAIDISENQLRHAIRADNIEYALSPAERTPFAENSFDLITIAQAYHWFDGPGFCREATRIARPNALVAVWAYDLGHIDPAIDPIIHQWNFEILAPYWEEERKHVYDHYERLPFEFERLPSRDFQIVAEWDVDHVIGHLRTWSALQRMTREVGDGPFGKVVADLRKTWNTRDTKKCIFPVFLKLGRIRK